MHESRKLNISFYYRAAKCIAICVGAAGHFSLSSQILISPNIYIHTQKHIINRINENRNKSRQMTDSILHWYNFQLYCIMY